MKLKLIIVLSILVLATFGVAGCFSDPVQDDLMNYINKDLPTVAPMEDEATKLYDSVSGDNYKDDETMYTVLKDQFIPKYKDFTTKLEEIQPKTKDVQTLHEVYISAANDQYNAVTQILDALEKQDRSVLAQANEKLDKARKGFRDFQSKLKELADEHNVEFKNQK